MNDKRANAARHYAKFVHEDQKYGEHPYIYHLDQVAQIVEFTSKLTEQEMSNALCVAYLHDTIEDGANAVEIYNKIEFLFGRTVADAVVELTRPKDKNYFNYIRSIESKIAIEVKKADLAFNISESKEGSRKDKYRFALNHLKMKSEFFS